MNDEIANTEELTLDKAFEQLDSIIAQMQSADITLEDAFTLYKNGVNLIELCNKKIEKVECDIKLLDSSREQE